MSTGFSDDDGTIRRLLCAGPPDGGAGGLATGGPGESAAAATTGESPSGAIASQVGPSDFVPNCCINGHDPGAFAISSDVAPVGPWLDDFALEAWAMPLGLGLVGDTTGAPLIGFGTDDIVGNGEGGGLDFRGSPTVAVRGVWQAAVLVTGAWVTLPAGWHLYTLNCDRSANMTLYIDGITQNTTDISASVAETIGNEQFFRDDSGAATLATGPIAWHEVLLTDAQIADSLGRKGVQLLAATQGAWDWRNLTGMTGWETRPAYIPDLYYNYGPNVDQPITMPWAVPLGTDDRTLPTVQAFPVQCPDLSGQGLTLYVSTRPAYTTATPAPGGGHSFGSDPFWR